MAKYINKDFRMTQMQMLADEALNVSNMRFYIRQRDAWQ